MKDGFVKVSAITTPIKVADVEYNVKQIIDAIKAEFKKGTKIAAFPELCITGATCQDLFMQKALLDEAEVGLAKIAEATKGHDTLFFVGLPWQEDGCVYDAVAAVQDGEILAVVSEEFNDCVFRCSEMDDLTVAVDFGDGGAPQATILVQMVAEPEVVGADDDTGIMLIADTARDMTAVIRANAGEGESTTDEVYGGYNIIVENGEILEESVPFTTGAITTDVDVQSLTLARIQSGLEFVDESYEVVDFSLKMTETKLDRFIDPMPFSPNDMDELSDIVQIQANGLKGRMQAIGCKNLVIGISGGLDSTCALLVASEACALMGLSNKNIHAITMPCFGTSDRTYENACKLIKMMGCKFTEINIAESVKMHLKDINHKISDHNVAYENAQARERTQILMDIANDENALVVGTGDLSEIALGWCTYNGDHMSNYAVNASIPKTLMKDIVMYYAYAYCDDELREILEDVVNTPISPELLPSVNGKTSQKTEDKIGPYELHDFFLYHFINSGFTPSKIYRMAKTAFEGSYTNEVIYNTLETFVKRFFSSQFKRNCMPDGPATGLISLSPRGSWMMPSDATRNIWLKELEKVKPAKKSKK